MYSLGLHPCYTLMLHLQGGLFRSKAAAVYAIMVMRLTYSMQQRKRKSRYKRLPAGERWPVRLTEKDVDILKLFSPGRYNYLTAELIASATDRPVNRVQHRLRQLYDSGYLRRYHRPHEQMGGSKKIVYLLDREGARILTAQLGEPVKFNRNFDPNSYHPFMEHTLLTNWFRVLVNAARRERSDIEIPYQYPDDHFSIRFKQPGYKMEFNIDPDFFFGLKNGNDQISNFFVEVQRPTRKTKESSSQQVKSIKRKLLAYFLFWKSQVYRNGDIVRSFPAVNNWKNIRVLIVTETGKSEHENLIRLVRKIDKQRKGVRLFLFAGKFDFSLDNPHSFFVRTWETAVDRDPLRGILDQGSS